MKRVFSLIMIFSIILSTAACKNDTNNNVEEVAVSAGVINKNSTTDFSADKNETTSSDKKLTLDNSEAQSTVLSEKTSENPTKSSVNNNISKDPPPMCYFTIEQFKEFKRACNTMNDEELFEYMHSKENLWGSQINSTEQALTYIEAIENTTVILLDGNSENLKKVTFHELPLYITQPITMSDTRNLVCTYYTNLSDENVKTKYEDNEYIWYITEVNANGVTADVYMRPNGDVDEFYVEMFVDGTRIRYRVTEEQTIEEFEADFARLEFVKIGDLISE